MFILSFFSFSLLFHIINRSNLQEYSFNPKYVYTFDFHQHVLKMSTFKVDFCVYVLVRVYWLLCIKMYMCMFFWCVGVLVFIFLFPSHLLFSLLPSIPLLTHLFRFFIPYFFIYNIDGSQYHPIRYFQRYWMSTFAVHGCTVWPSHTHCSHR